MTIPTIAKTAALAMTSTSSGTRELYIVVIDQKEKSMAAVNRAPNRAPIFRPSVIVRDPDHFSNNVRNKAIRRLERIIAHHIISPSGRFAHEFVRGAKKSISRIPYTSQPIRK
jgi:hypothetical protein